MTSAQSKPKAADIDDVEMLHIVEALCVKHDCWTMTGYVAECYPDVPYKVVAAKLSKLLKRGLVTGCDCGCRGDWELTTKGRELAGVAKPWRDNPMED